MQTNTVGLATNWSAVSVAVAVELAAALPARAIPVVRLAVAIEETVASPVSKIGVVDETTPCQPSGLSPHAYVPQVI